MWNPPTRKQLMKIPKLYSQDSVVDKKIYMKFFMGGWTWFVSEFDGVDTFYGFVVSPSSPEGEWGYFSLRELLNRRSGWVQVDRDLYETTVYSPKKLSELRK